MAPIEPEIAIRPCSDHTRTVIGRGKRKLRNYSIGGGYSADLVPAEFREPEIPVPPACDSARTAVGSGDRKHSHLGWARYRERQQPNCRNEVEAGVRSGTDAGGSAHQPEPGDLEGPDIMEPAG